MTDVQRRQAKFERRLEKAQQRLAETNPKNYQRTSDYKRVLTTRRNKVRRLERMIEGTL